LKSPDTDINTTNDLTNEESLIRGTVQSARMRPRVCPKRRFPSEVSCVLITRTSVLNMRTTN
jgi:hypothetical protein